MMKEGEKVERILRELASQKCGSIAVILKIFCEDVRRWREFVVSGVIFPSVWLMRSMVCGKCCIFGPMVHEMR
jgi:hypothetical protein